MPYISAADVAQAGYLDQIAENEKAKRQQNIDNLLDRLRRDGWVVCPPGCIPMPRNIEEAQHMNVVSERYIKDRSPTLGEV